MNLPREAIQPAAEDLVSYDDFVERLRELSASPRVRASCVGRSHEGRGLHTVVIADEQAASNLDYHRSIAARLQRPQVMHSTLSEWQQSERPQMPPDVRYPVLILAHSFGHEAAHLEALLELAEHLAWSDDPAVSAILSKLIVVIYPLANPDGREAAIRRWKDNRLGEDSPAAGNSYGFYVNRDILHLTQPEGEAVMQLFRDWHPIVLYDVHEDAYLLGVLTPEVCWCPAFGNASGGDIPDNIQDVIARLCKAIIGVWDTRGYNYYRGDMFAYPMIGQPPDKPYWFALGNAIITFGTHGIPSVITESSRTPGTQSWEDRLAQKFTAGMALLGETAAMADQIAETMYRNAENVIARAQGDAFIIPKDQPDTGALAKLIDVLLKQEVRVYGAEQAYVVPLAQAEAKIANLLLSTAESKLVAMPPAIGVTVFRLSALPENARKLYESAALTPILEGPTPHVRVEGQANESDHIAIPNTPDSVRLLNRLWRVGVPVYWLSEPVDGRLKPGAFVVENLPLRTLETLSAGLHLTLHVLPSGSQIAARRLRKPAVAVYLGQGVDRPDSVPKAEMWWAVETLGFDFIPLYGKQVRREWLERCDVLLVPDGDPNDIVQGWRAGSRNNSDAWDLPGEPDGIGEEGLAAIRAFVDSSGGYIGIGSGGGLLATADYAGIANLTVAHHSLGSGRVILRAADPASPLTYGLDGFYTENGDWQSGLFAAMYFTESLAGSVGGPIFHVGDGAQPIAYYQRVDNDPKTHYVIHPERFDVQANGVAVAYQQYGKGHVVVIGIRPGFRAVWTNSNKLVTNAIFNQVADQAMTVTLA